MGGINHQPCGKPDTQYLYFAIQMSRALSKARVSFEQANIELEDILLKEMQRESHTGSIAGMYIRLEESIACLRSLINHISGLRADMRMHGYEDLSNTLAVNAHEVANDLKPFGLASDEALSNVGHVMSNGNFYAILDMFDIRVAHLVQDTILLKDGVISLRTHEAKNTVTEVLERNLDGNIKIAFAKLYNNWNTFHELFLASSMLSTELWYRFMCVGSLVNGSCDVKDETVQHQTT